MGKKLKKVLASCLAMSMCMSMLGVSVSAAETTGTVKVETSGGHYENVDVVITIDKTENADGSVTENKSSEAENFKTNDGVVNYEDTSSMTTDQNNVTTGESESEYTVDDGDYHAAGGSEKTIEKGEGAEGASKITVDVPLTSEATKNQNTVEKVTSEVVTGDPKEYPEDGEYDYTKTTTSSQVTITTNEIKVTETQKAVDENNKVIGESNLDYVNSTVKPQGAGKGEVDNDLFFFENTKKQEHLKPEPGDSEGYEYMFQGGGNFSQYWTAFVTTEPTSEDAEVVYTDENGQKYYLSKHFDNCAQVLQNSFDSVYIDGKKVSAEGNEADLYVKNHHQVDNKWQPGTEHVTGAVSTTYGMVQQFKLVDMATGEVITTYCADSGTPTQKNFFYNIENIEDADYYSEEEAAMIRTIAANGYWGVEGNEIKTDENGNPVYQTDAEGNPVLDEKGNPIPVYAVKTDAEGNELKDKNGNPVYVPKSGSLEAMKDMLRDAKDENGNPVFNSDDLDKYFTDGMAMTATQMAIWAYSNKMSNIEFVNAHYTKDGDSAYTISSQWGANALYGNPDASPDKDAAIDLLFQVYEYLKAMEPTSYEENPTTSNTIINADNFLEDMSVTVIEKAADHENNQDDDDTNDAYVTNLSFALVVTPSTENGDDLIVKVLSSDGTTVLASGRIAGDLKEGETYVNYDKDTGNYFFKDIVMVEGEQNFNITLEGIQNLKEGVYLYTSEVVEGTSSQTMVGVATGDHAVDVSMNINFELSVEDEIVVTEHVWRDEWVDEDDGGDPPPPGGENPPSGGENPPSGGENPPEDFSEIPDEDIPLVDVEQDEIVELPEDEIPLADVPKTGDASAMWMLMSALSSSGLLGLVVLEKKRKED